MSTTVGTFGERNLILRIQDMVRAIGHQELMLDDSALVPDHCRCADTWITTDPCPMPNLVQRLGMGNNYHAGWLCVVKSLSDLAAMGARPTGVLLSAEFPSDTKLDEFDLFFSGAIDCSLTHGTSLIGGNIKESRGKPNAVSCAIGTTQNGRGLPRGTPSSNDVLFIVDATDFGGYWAGVASHIASNRCSALPSDLLSRIREMALKPLARVQQARLIADTARISFCMDNSDGLLASVFDLVRSGHVDAHLTLDDTVLSEDVRAVACSCGSDARAWAIGWGSCHLLCAANTAAFNDIKAALAGIGTPAAPVGEVLPGTGQVTVNGHGITKKVSSALRGDQFNPDSFWQLGPKKYADDMLSLSLEDLIDAR